MVPGYEQRPRQHAAPVERPRDAARSTCEIFNAGDYVEAVRAQTFAREHLQGALPGGLHAAGQGAAPAAAVLLRRVLARATSSTRCCPRTSTCTSCPTGSSFQLNDTHPVIAIPELMRILVDERGWDWDEAWAITQQCFAYTCHTLLPEALEVWRVDLLRHAAAAAPGDHLPDQRASSWPRCARPTRTTSCACAACRSSPSTPSGRSAWRTWPRSPASKVNGVAALHSPAAARQGAARLLRRTGPDKFTNVTNGVTPAAVRAAGQPARCRELITEAIGDGWVTDLERLRELEPLADDAEFRRAVPRGQARQQGPAGRRCWRRATASRSPPTRCSTSWSSACTSTSARCSSCCTSSRCTTSVTAGEPCRSTTSRRGSFAFGAKAAPGYQMAKQIIGLINAVGAHDQRRPGAGRAGCAVAFPANYNVTLAETLIPAADLSEQISLAGKEASGTGNMKFALNGALTIGTRRRRERRDPRARRRRQLLPVRPDRAGGRGHRRPPGTTRPRTTRTTRTLRRALDLIAVGHVLRRRPERVRARSCRTCCTRTGSWCWPTTRSYIDAQDRVDDGVRRHRRLDRGRRSSTSPAPGSSPPTGRCATTSTASGTRTRCRRSAEARPRAASEEVAARALTSSDAVTWCAGPTLDA